jgi:hypothetical protein
VAAFNLYDKFREARLNPTGAAISGTLKIMLVTAAYTPNQNTHQYKSSVTNEVSGTGYTARGNACTTPLASLDGSGNFTYDANDPAAWTQTAGGFTNARRAILYFDTGVDATSTLVGYTDDAGADLGNLAADLQVAFNAAGIYTSAR